MTQTSSHLVCAVDLGGTNLRAANVDREGSIHERVKVPTPKSDSAERIVSAIADAVTACEEKAAEREAQIDAISVVVPGSVHPQSGVVVNAPNVPAIVNFDLTQALATKLQRPIVIENDANAAAL